jgi:hypothetical protein
LQTSHNNLFESFERRMLFSTGAASPTPPPVLPMTEAAETIQKSAVGITLTADFAIDPYNARLTARVDANASGTISFYVDGVLAGTKEVVPSSGETVFAYFDCTLAGGDHTAFAVYGGDETHEPATSDTVTFIAQRLYMHHGMGKATRARDGSVILDFRHLPQPPTGWVTFTNGYSPGPQSTLASVQVVDGLAVLREVPRHSLVYIAYSYSGDAVYQGQRFRIAILPPPRVTPRPVSVDIVPPSQALRAGEAAHFQLVLSDPQEQATDLFGGICTITVDGEIVANAPIDAEGRGSVQLALPEGDHTVRAYYGAHYLEPGKASVPAGIEQVSVPGQGKVPQRYVPAVGEVVGNRWQVIANADFDGDGDSDLLFRHRQSGHAYLWLIQNTQVVSQSAFAAPAGWRTVGASDLNGDAKADLLWSNDAGRKQSIWRMNGIAILGFSMLNHAPRVSSWVLDEVKDLDNDGDADLVWRNLTTGGKFGWLMNGTKVVGGMNI